MGHRSYTKGKCSSRPIQQVLHFLSQHRMGALSDLVMRTNLSNLVSPSLVELIFQLGARRWCPFKAVYDEVARMQLGHIQGCSSCKCRLIKC